MTSYVIFWILKASVVLYTIIYGDSFQSDVTTVLTVFCHAMIIANLHF